MNRVVRQCEATGRRAVEGRNLEGKLKGKERPYILIESSDHGVPGNPRATQSDMGSSRNYQSK